MKKKIPFLIFVFFSASILLHHPVIEARAAVCGETDGLLADKPDFATEPLFQNVLRTKGTGAAFEKAKIDYLLGRLGQSADGFIRNGEKYTGHRAVAHLRWKYSRNLTRVHTADDFVHIVAAASKMSGERYCLMTPDGNTYSLESVMMNELKLAEAALTEPLKEGEAPAPAVNPPAEQPKS